MQNERERESMTKIARERESIPQEFCESFSACMNSKCIKSSVVFIFICAAPVLLTHFHAAYISPEYLYALFINSVK